MKDVYRTRSLMLAAYALLRGVEVAGIIPSTDGDRSVILLDNTDDAAWVAACEYYDTNPAVPIHDLANARTAIFDLIRAKRQEAA